MTDIAELKKRAEEGDTDAMWNLARTYRFGLKGVEKNLEKAKKWDAKRFPIVLKKAEEGNFTAMGQVAYSYGMGWGVEQNEAKSNEWFSKAQKHYDEGKGEPEYIRFNPGKAAEEND